MYRSIYIYIYIYVYNDYIYIHTYTLLSSLSLSWLSYIHTLHRRTAAAMTVTFVLSLLLFVWFMLVVYLYALFMFIVFHCVWLFPFLFVQFVRWHWLMKRTEKRLRVWEGETCVQRRCGSARGIAWVALLVWRYLYNAASCVLYGIACLIQSYLHLLHYSPLLKKTCIRQVVLDKWLPLNGVSWQTPHRYTLCIHIYIYIYIYIYMYT